MSSSNALGVEKAILRDYYGAGDPSKAYISSHWDQWSRRFDVRFDQEGNLEALEGAGFGNGKWPDSDQRALDLLCMASHLFHLGDRLRIIESACRASQICKSMGLDFTFDFFRQVCSLVLIQKFLPKNCDPLNLLVIGDGFGVLSALLKNKFQNSTLVLVDLGKTLLFQSHYCRKAFPRARMQLVSDGFVYDRADFVFCPAERLEQCECFSFDAAINIASMQEMSLTVVEHYFHFLRKFLRPDGFFYCCNRTRKELPGGEVSEFEKYPWKEGDRHHIDAPCPWHTYFFSKTAAVQGPHLFGKRIPFVNYYDGPHRHRLSLLSK